MDTKDTDVLPFATSATSLARTSNAATEATTATEIRVERAARHASYDNLIALTRSNSVTDWKQAILATLASSGNQCSLLTLMSAARLQSRSVKHPFNDALTALLDEKRVLWSDVPGHPIQISIL